jgi:hypothetical protein
VNERESGSERGKQRARVAFSVLDLFLLCFLADKEEGREEEEIFSGKARGSREERERERGERRPREPLPLFCRGKFFLFFLSTSPLSQSFQPSFFFFLVFALCHPPRHPSHAVHALHFGVHAVSSTQAPCPSRGGRERARPRGSGGSREEVIERESRRQLRSRLLPLLSLFRPPRPQHPRHLPTPFAHQPKRASVLFTRVRVLSLARERKRGNGRAFPRHTHLVVTRSRRHGNGAKSKSAHSSSTFPLSHSLNSAVAPRRGSLVIVANSKKTDIKKQGLNSIKVREMKGSEKRRSTTTTKSKKNASRKFFDDPFFFSSPLTLLSSSLRSFSFFFFSFSKNENRTTSCRPT